MINCNVLKSKDPEVLAWGKQRLGMRLDIINNIHHIKHMRSLKIGERYFYADMMSYPRSPGVWFILKKKWAFNTDNYLRLIVEGKIVELVGESMNYLKEGQDFGCHVGSVMSPAEVINGGKA